MSLLRQGDLLWRFGVDLERLHSVWPDAPADIALVRRNEFWNPDGLRFVHVGSGSRPHRRVEFMDEDDPLLDQLGRARKIDARLHAAGSEAYHVLAAVFGRPMLPWRASFGESVPHGDALRGTGSLAHLCPASRGVRIERLGRTLLRGRGSAEEMSTGRAIARWCDAELIQALGLYTGRGRATA